MRVLILGGTGPAGLVLTKEFLRSYSDGHAVLFARSPSKFPEDITSNKNVTIVKGEVTDVQAFESAFTDYGQIDAVLSMLGPTLNSKLDMPGAYETLLKLMHAHGCKRLICMSTYSNADPQDKFSLAAWLLVLIVKLLAGSAYKNITRTAELIREKSAEFAVEWTMPRVAILTMKENQKLSVGYVGDGRIGVYLSRLEMAKFFVDQLESREWVNKQPAISTTAQ